MVKLVWLSDLHFVCAGERVLDHDPSVRIDAAIAEINAHHADAQACVISGDLVNRGGADEYRELAAKLKRLAIPWIPMVGNHDHRDLLVAELAPPALETDDGFIQYAFQTDAGHVLCLDTLKPGSDAGEFCERRYAWLEAILSKILGQPVHVFMHHPPLPLGLPMQDVDCLKNGDQFLTFLKAHADVRHLFAGHVHRPVAGNLQGIPFTTMRSCLYQAPPPQPSWDWDTFAPAREAPNLGIVQLNDGNTVVHYHQFVEHAVGVNRIEPPIL